jgi:hypothetical protein
VHSSYCNSAYGRTAWGTCCKATWAGGTGCIVSDVGLGSNERGRQTLSVPADPERAASLIVLTAAEGDDERVIDDADGSAGFVGIVAASASTCRSPYERGRPQVVTPGSAAAPLPLLGAARLRYGSVCHRPLWSPRAVCRGWAVVRVAAPITEFGVGVVHSSSSWPLSRRRHRERR